MKITTTLTTTAVFNDDQSKRYLLEKVWDDSKPRLTIVMLVSGGAGGIELDTTTQLVLNNASRLGFGGVNIVNLFATLNDFALEDVDREDDENLEAILNAVKESDTVVYAPGTGKAKNKTFIAAQDYVLEALRPHEKKLRCLCNEFGGSRYQHPLSPQVRVWNLSPFKVNELISTPEEPDTNEKKKLKDKSPKKDEA